MPQLTAQIVHIAGPDALAFAQAQFASDVRTLATGHWQWTTWLTAQGRVRALAQLMRTGDAELHLLLRGGTAGAIAAALKPYVLRKRVTLTADAPAALIDALPCATGIVRVDTDDTMLGLGDHAIRITRAPAASPQHWRAQAILAGHPWLPESLLDTLLPAALGLPTLGAVSLGKGCFPGQEIVARMHYRGTSKQQLRRIECPIPLAPADTLRMDDAVVGTILDCVPGDEGTAQALAVMRTTVAPGWVTVTFDDRPCRIRVISDI